MRKVILSICMACVMILTACNADSIPGSVSSLNAVSNSVLSQESSPPNITPPSFEDGDNYVRLLVDPIRLNEFDFSCSASNDSGIAESVDGTYYVTENSIYHFSFENGISSEVFSDINLHIRDIIAFNSECIYFSVDLGNENSMYGHFSLFSYNTLSGMVHNVLAEYSLNERSLLAAHVVDDNLYLLLASSSNESPELVWINPQGISQTLCQENVKYALCGTSLFYQQGTQIFYVSQFGNDPIPLFEIYGYLGFNVSRGHLYIYSQKSDRKICIILNLTTLDYVGSIELGREALFGFSNGKLSSAEPSSIDNRGTQPRYNNFTIVEYSDDGNIIHKFEHITVTIAVDKLIYLLTDTALNYLDNGNFYSISEG